MAEVVTIAPREQVELAPASRAGMQPAIQPVVFVDKPTNVRDDHTMPPR
jgi:hypothetical protein